MHDDMKGFVDGMGKKKKPVAPMHEKSKGKSEEKKKAHGFHAKKVNGGWHVQHHDEAGKPIEGAEHVMPDDDAMREHFEDHFAEPNEGEPQADAGMHGVPDAQAGPAGLPLQGQPAQ